jgi:hypothetical protein
MMKKNKIIGALYGVVIVLFSILEPWGPIDTRDFSYMGDLKFWEYNIYISFVLIGILILAIKFWKNKIKKRDIICAVIINTMFLVMILFDLLHFFPDPKDPLPLLVIIIELITAGIILGITIHLSSQE